MLSKPKPGKSSTGLARISLPYALTGLFDIVLPLASRDKESALGLMVMSRIQGAVHDRAFDILDILLTGRRQQLL